MTNYLSCRSCGEVFPVMKMKEINICTSCEMTLNHDTNHQTSVVPEINLYEEYSPDDYDSDEYFDKGPRGDIYRNLEDFE